MSAKWEIFKKNLSSLKSKINIGSHRNFNTEVKHMVETAIKNGEILKDEYQVNYNKLRTFGKDARIIKIEKYIKEYKKDLNKIKKLNEYFDLLKKKTYNEYVEDTFGGSKMNEFLRETVSSPIQFTKVIKENKPQDKKTQTNLTIEFWQYMDICAHRTQKKISEMLEFKSKVEKLVKLAVLDLNKQKQQLIKGTANIQNPHLMEELTKKIKR